MCQDKQAMGSHHLLVTSMKAITLWNDVFDSRGIERTGFEGEDAPNQLEPGTHPLQ